MTVAQSALAKTDFSASDAAFSNAQAQLVEAQKSFDEAFSSSKDILRYVDITGTVRSGEDLLSVGQDLTEAGQHISRGLAPLLHSTDGVFAVADKNKEPDSGSSNLITAVKDSQIELKSALISLQQAQDTVATVSSPLLPTNIQSQVDKLKKVLPTLTSSLKMFLDRSDTMLSILGADRQKQYLLVFANNHELRPVGGFLGSIALINVDKGKVENIDVKSVYDPDGQLHEFIAPPSPLLPITNRWYLRDANWFVNYPDSAKKITQFFEKEGGPTVDGVILMTPEVIRQLLTITGPIAVPGYNVTVSADNFYDITQDQVTYSYDRTINKPKQFLADLTPLLLNTLMGDGNTGKLGILQALAASLEKKDLLLYFRDQVAQQQIEQAGWAGTLPDKEPGFLMVNNANIGGSKSDEYMEQEIDSRTQVNTSGDVDVVLTIRRTHHGPTEGLVKNVNYPNNEEPAKKDNVIYQRVLVPAGAQLIDAKGYTPASLVPHPNLPDADLAVKPDGDVVVWEKQQVDNRTGTAIGSEAGYTYFANWIITHPGETTVTLYHYIVPKAAAGLNVIRQAGNFGMYFAKQSGAERTTLRASLVLPESWRIIHRVPSQGITQDNDYTLVYRGPLDRDIVVGAVYDSAK